MPVASYTGILKSNLSWPVLPLRLVEYASILYRKMAGKRNDYSGWSHESLVKRVEHLEEQLKQQTDDRCKVSTPIQSPSSSPRRPRNARVKREFDPSKYSTRLIALKFAYLGQKYNGLEYHANNKTALPTVEEVLWKALNKARLIFPTPDPSKQHGGVNWDGCEYSKCGRTDRGVSAFGQVIGIRVRSNRPLGKDLDDSAGTEDVIGQPNDNRTELKATEEDSRILKASTTQPQDLLASTDSAFDVFDPINDEIPYPQVLNRLLPPDIRVLAWCPSPPNSFSARFACKERRYKYFFTQPAFSPIPGAEGIGKGHCGHTSTEPGRREGWLNVQTMREAAKKFEGLHDFRNFCKVDPSKQIENFERRIFHADIDELDPQKSPVGYLDLPEFQEHDDGQDAHLADGRMTYLTKTPKVFMFSLHGSAFLWHQVRHMVAILFLIGQGLEGPDLVDELLDVAKNPLKPQYEMADDAPLVLWDCIFPEEGNVRREDALEWKYAGDYSSRENGISKMGSVSSGKYGRGSIVDETWKIWRQSKMDEILAGTLLDVMVGQGQSDQLERCYAMFTSRPPVRQRIFLGGNGPRLAGTYVPVLSKPRMDSVEEINARYAKRKNLGAMHAEIDIDQSELK